MGVPYHGGPGWPAMIYWATVSAPFSAQKKAPMAWQIQLASKAWTPRICQIAKRSWQMGLSLLVPCRCDAWVSFEQWEKSDPKWWLFRVLEGLNIGIIDDYRGYIGDEILSKYVGDYFINHDTRIPIKPTKLLNNQDFPWNVSGLSFFVFRGTLKSTCSGWLGYTPVI